MSDHFNKINADINKKSANNITVYPTNRNFSL